MGPVVIGETGSALMLSVAQTDGAMPPQYLLVTLHGPDLRASREVYAGWADGFADLAAFFAQLARQWRGWRGTRNFESVEGDWRIEATHDGHVGLRVVLCESTAPERWMVEAHIRLDAGEALASAASQVAVLVGATHA